jgi:thiol-disulfide isomerase/thioredoxin
MTDRERQGSKLPARTATLAAALAASVGFAAIYVTLGHSDNAARTPTPAPPMVQAQAAAPAPAAGEGASGPGRSELAAFVFRKEPEVLPEIKFQDGDGRERSLADWRGKVVLLNLWATWCLPCRKEMPALDRLQASLGSDQFQVVAISVDRTGLAGAKKFLEETKTPNLAVYADPTARLASSLRAAGLPATLLIDKEGREIGRLLGPAEWDGEAARHLIQSALR